jgi:pyruvate ferredoxin oxidoreductase gamma subunit
VLIVQDPTLLHQVDVFQGLKPDGWVLINTRRSFDELGLARSRRLPPRAADHRAGQRDRTSSTWAGRCPTRRCWAASRRWPAWSALEAVVHAIRHTFSGALAEGNVAAATEPRYVRA